MENQIVTEDLFEDIDFLEQPGESTGSALPWLMAGAALGLGWLYLMDPRHGETRRDRVKGHCTTLSCRVKRALGDLKSMMQHKASDLQAEVRARAPQYLQ